MADGPGGRRPRFRVAQHEARELGKRDREMSERVRIRVFSVDDHPLLREGIAAIINNQADMTMVAQAANVARRHRTIPQAQT